MAAVNPMERMFVVIPAHDEEQTLRACLESVEEAAREVPDLEVRTVLVLDDCSDGSAQVAASFPHVRRVAIAAASVGAARAAGAASLLLGMGDKQLERTWLVTTDADSTVSPDWLKLHRAVGDSGADALIGAVVPVLDDLDDARATAWRAVHWPGATLGHVHGANLGLRASVYRAVGGFLPASEDEDVELMRSVRALGARVAHSEAAPVVTSARLQGRVPHGYADYLRQLGCAEAS